jgi:hypothetical protein
MTGGTLTSKIFKSLHEATMFAVYQVAYNNVYGIDKVD